MSEPDVPDRWTPYNLRGNPFAPALFEEGREDPLDFFVGRKEEAGALLEAIRVSQSSRQIIEGIPGCGRGMLAEYVKRRAEKEEYLVGPGSVRITRRHSVDELLVALLKHVRDSLARHVPQSLQRESRIMRRAKALIQHQRRLEVTALTLGLRPGQADPRSSRAKRSTVGPSEVVPELLERMLDLARKSVPERGRGVVIHLSGMDGLKGYEIRAALRVLSQVMEVFLVSGYHYLLVGAPHTLRSLRRREPAIARLFPHRVALAPLSADTVEALMEQRYRVLRSDPDAPFGRPVPPGIARALAPFFDGDLRALMLALERLAHESEGADRDLPMNEEECIAILRRIYEAEAACVLSEVELECLRRMQWMEGEEIRQARLKEVWQLHQSRVSDILSHLMRYGYVRKVGWEGRTIRYAITGAARLALDVRESP